MNAPTVIIGVLGPLFFVVVRLALGNDDNGAMDMIVRHHPISSTRISERGWNFALILLPPIAVIPTGRKTSGAGGADRDEIRPARHNISGQADRAPMVFQGVVFRGSLRVHGRGEQPRSEDMLHALCAQAVMLAGTIGSRLPRNSEKLHRSFVVASSGSSIERPYDGHRCSPACSRWCARVRRRVVQCLHRRGVQLNAPTPVIDVPNVFMVGAFNVFGVGSSNVFTVGAFN